MPCRSPLSFVGWDQRSASPTSSMPQNSRIRFVRGADNDFMFHSRLEHRERSVCVRYFRGAKGDYYFSNEPLVFLQTAAQISRDDTRIILNF